MSRSKHPKETTTTSKPTDLETLKSLLDSITSIAGTAPALTATDRKRSLKLRKGGEKVIPTLLALSNRIGLSVPSHPTATIQENLDKVKALSPVYESVTSAQKHLSDAIFQAQSAIWDGATVHYAVLKRLAKNNGDVANTLAPVAEFFAQKSPAVVKAEEQKRGGRKGTTKPEGSAVTPASTTTETSSAQAPAASPASTPAPAAVENGAAHS